MNNLKPLIKRVCAYMIDLLIVITISSLISNIPAINKNMEVYQNTYDEYVSEYNTYSEYLSLLETSYEDEEITEEEYNNLIEEEKYKDLIISKYDDNKISQGEYKKIIEELETEQNEITNEYSYLLSKYGVFNSVITLLCTLLYFGVLQYFLKGQTIGKKLLKLQVVSASDKEINILNYLLRSLLVNDVLLNAVGVIFLIFASKKVYLQTSNILSILVSISEAIIIFLVLTREDCRGLHDLLFNTKVIDLEDSNQSQIEDNENKIENKSDNSEITKSKKKENKKKENTKVIEAEYKEEVKENGKEGNKKTERRSKKQSN